MRYCAQQPAQLFDLGCTLSWLPWTFNTQLQMFDESWRATVDDSAVGRDGGAAAVPTPQTAAADVRDKADPPSTSGTKED